MAKAKKKKTVEASEVKAPKKRGRPRKKKVEREKINASDLSNARAEGLALSEKELAEHCRNAREEGYNAAMEEVKTSSNGAITIPSEMLSDLIRITSQLESVAGACMEALLALKAKDLPFSPGDIIVKNITPGKGNTCKVLRIEPKSIRDERNLFLLIQRLTKKNVPDKRFSPDWVPVDYVEKHFLHQSFAEEK